MGPAAAWIIGGVAIEVVRDPARIVGLLEPRLAADPVRNTVLADALAALLPSLAAFGGPVSLVRRVAAALADRGLPATGWVDERLFRLDELIPPAGVAGAPRLATRDDLALLAEWAAAFTSAAFGRLPPAFDADALAERALTRSRIWLWTDPGGAPVSMAWRLGYYPVEDHAHAEYG